MTSATISLTPHDFHRAAVYLLGRYGNDAIERAANRTTELQAAGETALHQIWHVLTAVMREVAGTRGLEARG
jgi:hypothetical protein